MKLQFTAYDSPDGFTDWLHFWYRDLDSGHQVRVAIHAKEFMQKGPPGRAGDTYRMAFVRGVAMGVLDQARK